MSRVVRGSADDGGIVVSGGAGGFLVACDDLDRVVVALRLGADVLGSAAFAVHRLDLWSLELFRSGISGGISGGMADSVMVAALGRVLWRRAALVSVLRDLSDDVDSLARSTQRAVNEYRLAEHDAALTVQLARLANGVLTRALQGGGRPWGLFDDGVAAPVVQVPVDVESRIEIWDLASLVTSQSLLSGAPVVRVIEVPQPDGGSAWILQIPGTQEWDPRAGPIAHDLTADLALIGGQDAVLTRSALAALAQAQAGSGRLDSGDPVLITGHSLGGIAAMSIAADPRARRRFAITHVLTAGSPTGHFAVPDEIAVLSLEHNDDIVPRADSTPNPDRANWTTVRRDVPGGRMLNPGTNPSEHAAITYRETARLAGLAAQNGSQASLAAWSATAAPFLPGAGSGTAPRAGDQRIRDYRVGRVTESRS